MFYCVFHQKRKKTTALHIENKNIFLKKRWAANVLIWMISEGSCDIGDWSNDAENSALHYRNKFIFKNIFK